MRQITEKEVRFVFDSIKGFWDWSKDCALLLWQITSPRADVRWNACLWIISRLRKKGKKWLFLNYHFNVVGHDTIGSKELFWAVYDYLKDTP